MMDRMLCPALQSGRTCPTPSTCGGWTASGMTPTGSDAMDTCSEADGEVFEKEHVALSDIIVKTGHCFSSQILRCF